MYNSMVMNSFFLRRKSRPVTVAGKVIIGGGAPIVVQSMTTTDTRDVEATVAQIKRLEDYGCELVRVAVLDEKAGLAVPEIKKRINIPLVCDIHFDYKLALLAIKGGADKLRINPGNIGAEWKTREVVRAAAEKNIPIRIGVNSGSLPKDLWEKHGGPKPEAIVEAALRHCGILEDMGYNSAVVSLKSSDVNEALAAYRLFAEKSIYPLHLGITEAGSSFAGSIKSAVGIGTLLAEGIGDTIRVSLADDPTEEVKVAFEILKSLGLRQRGPVIIACPTCGRCEIDMFSLLKRVETEMAQISYPIRVSIMGCVVNGPGEAAVADVGVAGGRGIGLIYRGDKVVKKVKEEEIFNALMDEVQAFLAEKQKAPAGAPVA